MTPHIVNPENAKKFYEWITTRGGLAIWDSIDLSDPNFSITTPVLDKDGNPTVKPHWKLGEKPARIITNAEEVVVRKYVEVKRFHVGIRVGSQGMTLKVTDGGSRRIRTAVSKAGEGAYHVFDYETQEAVIMKPVSTVPLLEFLEVS